MNIIEHLSDFLGRRQSILVETTEHHGGAFKWRNKRIMNKGL